MAISERSGQEAGKRVFERLQEELNKHDAGLERVAERLSQGLDSKRTIFAQQDGVYRDSRELVDYGERRKYAELVIAVFGAKAPTTQEVTGPGGGPLQIEYVNDWRGKGED